MGNKSNDFFTLYEAGNVGWCVFFILASEYFENDEVSIKVREFTSEKVSHLETRQST